MEFEEYKDSGSPWLGRIPEHWNNYSFKRVFKIIYRYPTYYDIEYVSEGIPEIRGEALNKYGLIDKLETERYVSSETNAQFPQTQLAEGDIIISVRGTMGKIGFVDQRYIGANITANLLRLSPKSGIADGRFLRWFFMGDYFLQRLEATSPQTTIKTVTMPQLSKISLLLPPLDDQRRIAAYLDKTCAAIDTAIEKKQKQLETLDALHKSILHTAFAKDEWPVERIKDIANKIGSGVTPEGGASNYLDDGIPLLRSQNVHFDGLRLDDVAFISEETHNEMAGSQLKPRDVLLNITGASIGRCTFVSEDFGEGNVNQHVCIIRGNHKIDYCFLAAFLSSPIGQGQILSSFTGASRQGLSHKELGLIRIPLPSVEEQRKVVAVLEEQKSRENQVRTNIESQIGTLIAYRKSLIHECVTGKRRITEADMKGIHQN